MNGSQMSNSFGAHEANGKYICDKCNADLSLVGNMKILGRYYGYNQYGSVVKCKRCQSVIQINVRGERYGRQENGAKES